MSKNHSGPVLVIGATGYVGARLIPRLLSAGYPVRAVSRSLDRLKRRPWAEHPRVDLVVANVLEPDALAGAVKDCRTAYFLLPALGPGGNGPSAQGQRAARALIEAAEAAGLERIIALSGLDDYPRSPAVVLRGGRAAVTVLRTAMILGSGSSAFEILRYLVDRLPLMLAPSWVETPAQPIAIGNLLHYLAGCLEAPETAGQTFEVGGPEVVSCRQLMEVYRQEARLARRHILTVPLCAPALSSHWISLTTPVPRHLARSLTAALSRPLVAADARIREIIRQDLLDCRQAIRLALAGACQERLQGPGGGGPMPPPEWSLPGDAPWSGGTMYEDRRRLVLRATAEEIWQSLIGVAWRNRWGLRDWLGRSAAAPGGRGCGALAGDEPGAGHDGRCWRAASVEPPERLVLVSQMRLPGQMILEFRLRGLADHLTEIEQKSLFAPAGLPGILYWSSLGPVRALMFNSMLVGMARAAGKQIELGPQAVHAPSGSALLS